MEEKIKKTSTPRKPRTTAAKTTAAKEIAPKRTAKAKVTEMKASPEQIAQLAHQLWAERGYEHGHDAEDWIRAEQMLRGKAS